MNYGISDAVKHRLFFFSHEICFGIKAGSREWSAKEWSAGLWSSQNCLQTFSRKRESHSRCLRLLAVCCIFHRKHVRTAVFPANHTDTCIEHFAECPFLCVFFRIPHVPSLSADSVRSSRRDRMRDTSDAVRSFRFHQTQQLPRCCQSEDRLLWRVQYWILFCLRWSV